MDTHRIVVMAASYDLSVTGEIAVRSQAFTRCIVGQSSETFPGDGEERRQTATMPVRITRRKQHRNGASEWSMKRRRGKRRNYYYGTLLNKERKDRFARSVLLLTLDSAVCLLHLPLIEIGSGQHRNLITIRSDVVAVYQAALHRTITTHPLRNGGPAKLLHQLHFRQVVEQHLVAVRYAGYQVVLVPARSRTEEKAENNRGSNRRWEKFLPNS